jgi:hypothetical protein
MRPMELDDLQHVIERAGGGDNATAYAPALLEKLKLVQADRSLAAMLNQLWSAKEPGDLRGRVLEVQFAHAFLTHPRRPPKVPHLWPPKLLHPAGGDLMH